MGIFVKEKKEDIFSLTPVQENMNDIFLNEGEAGAEYIIRYIEEARLTLAKDILKEMLILKETALTEGAATENFVKAVKVLIDKFVTMCMNGWNKILAFYYKSATGVKTRFGGLEKYFEMNKNYIIAGINQAKPIGTYNILDLSSPIIHTDISITGVGKALYPKDDTLSDILCGGGARGAIQDLYTNTGVEGQEAVYKIQDVLSVLNMSDTEMKNVINKNMISKFITIDNVSDIRSVLENEFKKAKMLANLTTPNTITTAISELSAIYNEKIGPEAMWLASVNTDMNTLKVTMGTFKEVLDSTLGTEHPDAEALIQSTKLFVNKLGTIRSTVLQNVTTYSSTYAKYVMEDISTWSTILTKLCAIGKQVEKNG